jgi:hypothetical protein
MILFHFTLADRAEQILTDGLKPAYDGHAMLGGADVVWLTERSVLRISAAERAAVYKRSGEIYRSWLFNTIEDQVVRLSIHVPSHDRRLERYRAWLRKHWRPGMPHPDDTCMDFAHMDAHWIYFGEIPPSSIVAVDRDRSDFSEAETLIEDIAVAS